MCLCLAVILSRRLSVCALSVSVMFAPMSGLNFPDPLFVDVPGCPSVALSLCLCSVRLCHVCSHDGSDFLDPVFVSVPGCPSVALAFCLCSLRLCHVCSYDGSAFFKLSLCVCAWLSFCSGCLAVCALSISVMFAPMMGLYFSDPPVVSVPGCPSVALSFCLCSLRLCHVCSHDGSEFFRPSLCGWAWQSFCRVAFLSVLSPSLSCLLR